MPARKRGASEPSEGGRRRSGRISSTPKKSSYFEDPEDELSEPPRKRGRPSKCASIAKEETEDEFDDYTDEVEEPVQENEDEDDEVDEDAPMQKTIIPLEKMRDTGGIEYEDEKIHKNTVLFLRDLKANNKRSWLKCELPSWCTPG
jgi:hypothetical protein